MRIIDNITGRTRALGRLLAPGVQMPVYLLMFVTNRCNAACEHCFYWRELNEKIKDELSLAEFQRLAEALGPLLQCTLTGGSPELRNDLPEIAAIFSRTCRPANITFCMLGFSTARIVKQLAQILSENPEQRFTVAISLDGIGEEHDRLRKLPGSFDRATKTLHELGKMKTQYNNLRLAIGMTVHALNYKTVHQTARWARESLPVDLLKPILVRGDPLNREVLDRVCVPSYLNVIDEDRERLNRHQASLSPMDVVVHAKEVVQRKIISSISTTGQVPVVCSGARETAVIYPTGDVAGCELRSDILGNIRKEEYNFSKIWFNQSSKSFRASAGTSFECAGCYHHCFLSPAIFRSPEVWPAMIRAAASITWRRYTKGYSEDVTDQGIVQR